MCNGTIMDKLISFSIPLMLSGILQLMFNAVDIVVVGRFSGSQALAAVGSTTALINVFTNLFIGISLGANVLAARYYATGKTKEMSETVHTAIALALVSGVAMAVIGVVFARGALEIMGTPDDVIAKSTLYMRIYFCGMPFFMMYNYGAAILRAVGDTKRPLIFLIVSGVINAVLNLFLVIGFHLDVAGVGIATVISQLVSCILVLRCLHHTESSYQLHLAKLRIRSVYLKQIFEVGVPAGIQSGQDAVNVAKEFNEKVGIDGVIVTKLDGDTRGGAALSVKAVTGKPILYVGMGEKLSDLEQFYPDRMASRILGMGDVLSLIEKAEAEIDEEKAREMTQKLKKNQFDFDDYLESIKQMKNMGGLGNIMNMLPGLGGMGSKMKGLDDEQTAEAERKMGRMEAIIHSMTPAERANPDILSPSRKHRIAKGAGVDISEVNRMIKQFNEMKKLMKQFGKPGKKKKFGFPF